LISSYTGIKLYIFNRINQEIPGRIGFSDLSIRIFPLGFRVKNINRIPLKNRNLISFKSFSLEIPFWSLFSHSKEVTLIIENPRILFNKSLFDQTRNSTGSTAGFRIRAIKITDGELLYVSRKLTVNLMHFNLDSVQFPNYTSYQLESPFLKVAFPIEKKKVTIEGNLVTKLKQHQDEIKINQFLWSTNDFRVNAHGRIFFESKGMTLDAFVQGNPEKILRPLLEKLAISGLTYGNARITMDKNQKLSVIGRFNARNFSSGGQPFSDLQGRAAWDNVSDNLKINAYFLDRQYRTNLKIDTVGNKTKLLGFNFSGNSLSKAIDIYKDVPLGGIVEKGDILVEGKIISGTVQLKPQPDATTDFNVKGQVQFRYDLRKKQINFQSDNLAGEFGRVSLTGEVIVPEKRIDLTLQSGISEMGEVNKYSKYFIDLDISPWKLRQGKGSFSLNFKKRRSTTHFTASMDIKNFFSNGQPINQLKGTINGENETVNGTFSVSDGSLNGNASLFLQDGNIKIDFHQVNGEARKILSILDIDIPLQGPVKGDFSYTHTKGETLPLVEGNFFSDRMEAYYLHFKRFTGKLRSNLEYINLRDIKYSCYGGSGNAGMFIDFKNRNFSISGKAKDIRVKQINREFRGTGKIEFSGQGDFLSTPIKIKYQINDFYYYRDRTCNITGQANVKTDFSDFNVVTIGFVHHNKQKTPFNITLTKTADQYSGIFKTHLKDINYLLPWKNNQGSMTLEGQIKTEETGKISFQGLALFQGDILVFPNFPHTLKDFKALVTFKDLNFTLSSLKGNLANGTIKSNGFLAIENNKIKDLQVNLEGSQMNLYLIDKTSGTVNADLNLTYINHKLLLQGNLHILSMLWERELDEGIKFYTQPQSTKADTRVLNLLNFDINLIGRENIRMVNSFGNINCSCDLRLTGDYTFPIITGKIEAKEGVVFFSDKTFNLIKGKMVFNNKFQIDPLIDLQSEAFIKNYRIRFNIRGPLSRVKPEFQSSPPLPPQDILALISLGELFKRPTSTELSSQITTTGMITTKLTESLKKRVKKIFGIDLLKIDPLINGTSVEGESRVSVGKAISKDLIIVYSTNISTSRQEILYLLYQVSPSISIIGMRNEEGRYSIDIRFRKRR
jgi:hypothetical protein